MKPQRQIAVVVHKTSINEASLKDDLFWASTSVEFRIHELFDLIKLNYGPFGRMEKKVTKGNINEKKEI
jgi:hypothetical protein